MRPLTGDDPRAVGEFRLRARLGAGGMGRVYLGFSPSGRAVAVKVVRRDLKPANVLLAVDGPRVIDFGISRALDGTSMTATGMIIGTPGFMSPEQATAAPTGPSSDVFSLGCLIAFAAAGVPPFGDGNPATVLYQIVHSPPALDLVPEGIRGFVADCLAKRPGDRPALPALAETIAKAMPPDAPASLASFWPAAITGMIASYQAQLGAVYIASLDHNVYALRASDGSKLWSYDTGAAVYPRPAVANNAVYAGSDDNYVYALQV